MTKTEADATHQMYSRAENGSPEYQRVVRSWGRMLAPKHVIVILRQHSLEAEYKQEVLGGIYTYPAETDAAVLFEWLGY